MNLFKPNFEKLVARNDFSGLVNAAPTGLKDKDLPICLKSITAIGKLDTFKAIQPLLTIAEEAYRYFPECHETITTAVFIAIRKTGSAQALDPLLSTFEQLSKNQATRLPLEMTDQRYRAFVMAIQELGKKTDKNLANILMKKVLYIPMPDTDNQENSTEEVRIAALDVLGVIGDLEDAAELEKGFRDHIHRNESQDYRQAFTKAIENIKIRFTLL